MIRTILFDCFGVLTESRWLALVNTLKPDVRREVIDVHHTYERGFTEYAEYRRQITSLTGISDQEADDIFIYRRGYQKNTELLSYISELSKNYSIGVLSNAGTSWIRDEFLTASEAATFSDIILSYEVGLIKPDPAIFYLACERLGVKPAETVFVDDQRHNFEAANTLGMKGILYTNFVQFKHDLQQIINRSE